MNKNVNKNGKHAFVKISVVALITILLLIPLQMIKNVIENREETMHKVSSEVAKSYASGQFIHAPYIVSKVVDDCSTSSIELDYAANVETEVLHRSIYDITVYKSRIDISGKFPVTAPMLSTRQNTFVLRLYDPKGFGKHSSLKFGDNEYELRCEDGYYRADVTLPDGIALGCNVDFSLSFDLKGTESLFFHPSKSGVTTVSIVSSNPNPSFQGDILPSERNVRSDGFDAKWEVMDSNSSSYDQMGVKFVSPVNPYQQSMRCVKYGILIIVLMFVAGLLVEFITRKEINLVQYVVIGLSLVLFYSLLFSFSEFIPFAIAYLIAALMTTGALTFYFRAILKNTGAYLFGVFTVIMYAMNYLLLQMETYALLAGSIVLFVLLCVVMYLTASDRNVKVEDQESGR